MDGCPEVLQLPKLSVAEYIASQATEIYESAHDEYLTLMQHLADGAFALLLESGLAAAGDRQTLKIWREMGRSEPEKLVTEMGQDWLDALMLPELTLGLKDPKVFCNLHYERLQHKAQASFGALDNFGAMRQASGLMMGLALHLGRGLGANPAQMVEHWIKTAKTHGAKE